MLAGLLVEIDTYLGMSAMLSEWLDGRVTRYNAILATMDKVLERRAGTSSIQVDKLLKWIDMNLEFYNGNLIATDARLNAERTALKPAFHLDSDAFSKSFNVYVRTYFRTLDKLFEAFDAGLNSIDKALNGVEEPVSS